MAGKRVLLLVCAWLLLFGVAFVFARTISSESNGASPSVLEHGHADNDVNAFEASDRVQDLMKSFAPEIVGEVLPDSADAIIGDAITDAVRQCGAKALHETGSAKVNFAVSFLWRESGVARGTMSNPTFINSKPEISDEVRGCLEENLSGVEATIPPSLVSGNRYSYLFCFRQDVDEQQ